MMYCDTCGGVLFCEALPGEEPKYYCRKCNPKVARITSINSHDLDISLKELYKEPGVLQEVDGNPVIYHGSKGQAVGQDPPSITTSDGTSSVEWNINMEQPKEPFRTVETKAELPETGDAGGPACSGSRDWKLAHLGWRGVGEPRRCGKRVKDNAHFGAQPSR